MLQSLRQEKLYVNLSNYTFGNGSIQYLDHHFTSGGGSADPQKAEMIWEWPTPKTKVEVQSFPVFVIHYRRFSQSSSGTAKSLTFLKSNVPLKKTKKHTAKFITLREAGRSAPVLKPFHPEQPVFIRTDTSKYAIGCCYGAVRKWANPLCIFPFQNSWWIRTELPCSRKRTACYRIYSLFVAALHLWKVLCDLLRSLSSEIRKNTATSVIQRG